VRRPTPAGYVLARFSVKDSERQSARLPFLKIGHGHIARGFRIIETAARVAFDQLRHGPNINQDVAKFNLLRQVRRARYLLRRFLFQASLISKMTIITMVIG
jgi:hypothetical protein